MAGSLSDEMVVNEPMKGLRCTSAGDTCIMHTGEELRGAQERGGMARVGRKRLRGERGVSHLGVGLDDVTDAGEELVALQAVLAVGQRALVAWQQGKISGEDGQGR